LGRIGFPPEVVLPLGDLLELIQQEDAFPLRFADGFHNPDPALFFELFHEE
jgi:hypothetical protein